ncbi:hypothetical protein GH714_005874 [Hevea brasiliensis]|uniref:PGG domain-containing protein n=1 Tax=Hevea brasiliensis TaxID=3981 RepID=A0A6A6MZ33_HEVBR|nr:hypothetical protein GH714_005874 [Hevea brasiliensis]
MKNYLMANDLWDIVEATTEVPNPEEAEAEFKAWRKKNAAALHAIQISCMPHILFQIKEISSARICWDILAKMHEVKSSGDQILPQEAELPPVEVLLQLPAAVSPAGTERDVYVEFRPLRNAIEIGDLNAVREFLRRRPDAVCKKLIDNGFTALHLATSTGKLKMVEELVKLLTEEELKVTDNLGGTALLLAAATGATRIAECMIKKNSELVSIPGKEHNLPVIMACTYRHKDMARYLYSITPFELLRPEKEYMDLCFFMRLFLVKCLVQLPAAQHTDVRISIPQDGHAHPESNLVRGLGPLRRFGSNLLQLFAKLAPPDRLASISGAALQMQRELQWYKEVESIVDPSFQENVNMLMKHLRKYFLINTSTFTVPGGNFQDTGFPIFIHRKSFMTFIISDAISLFASSTSVLMFLGILTSRES